MRAQTLTSRQSDKLTSLITAAKVPDVEPIWASLFAKALEGKDVKDLLLNVGSGGGAAAAPAAAGGAAAGDATADAAEAEPEKKEGELSMDRHSRDIAIANIGRREGGVRRGHGLRSFRLSDFFPSKRWQGLWTNVVFVYCSSKSDLSTHLEVPDCTASFSSALSSAASLEESIWSEMSNEAISLQMLRTQLSCDTCTIPTMLHHIFVTMTHML